MPLSATSKKTRIGLFNISPTAQRKPQGQKIIERRLSYDPQAGKPREPQATAANVRARKTVQRSYKRRP
ncbi:hypothetical protein ANCDUO_00145 [Ancylostoma duodenale]|uniref:Uncharacterized protein n=1 Tax=Ancylostoma duodenale TaxID=51022 RepID=A0A0C2HIT9_9BILA|nr:hypothetical protein ANCDUO_00145 [Ancylostoma duodenale]